MNTSMNENNPTMNPELVARLAALEERANASVGQIETIVAESQTVTHEIDERVTAAATEIEGHLAALEEAEQVATGELQRQFENLVIDAVSEPEEE